MFVYSPIGAERRVARLIKESATLIEQAESLLYDCNNDVFSASMSDVVHRAGSAPLKTSGCFEDNDSAGNDALAGLIAQKAAELMKMTNLGSDVTAAQAPLNSSDNASTNGMTNPPSADTASCASDRQTGDRETPLEDAVSLYAFLCVFLERSVLKC